MGTDVAADVYLTTFVSAQELVSLLICDFFHTLRNE